MLRQLLRTSFKINNLRLRECVSCSVGLSKMQKEGEKLLGVKTLCNIKLLLLVLAV